MNNKLIRDDVMTEKVEKNHGDIMAREIINGRQGWDMFFVVVAASFFKIPGENGQAPLCVNYDKVRKVVLMSRGERSDLHQ